MLETFKNNNMAKQDLHYFVSTFIDDIPEYYIDRDTGTGLHINGLPSALFYPADNTINLVGLVSTPFIEMALDSEWSRYIQPDFFKTGSSAELPISQQVLLGAGNNFKGTSDSGLMRQAYLYKLPELPYLILYHKFLYLSK